MANIRRVLFDFMAFSAPGWVRLGDILLVLPIQASSEVEYGRGIKPSSAGTILLVGQGVSCNPCHGAGREPSSEPGVGQALLSKAVATFVTPSFQGGET